MTIDERIEAFVQLGFKLKEVLKQNNAAFEGVLQNAWHENNWFDNAHSRLALCNIVEWLRPENLKTWINRYDNACFSPAKTLRVGVVMAGNIPLVGFHDMLCVLISGHQFVGKMSSEDRVLLPYLANELCCIYPEFTDKIILKEDLKAGFDAIIATGSNNTSRYFEHYFGKYPHIIRHHRNSVAILTGNESDTELEALADDICLYYGRGCRSISKVYISQKYDFKKLLKALHKYAHFENHHKHFSNYEYNKALFMINKVPFIDTGLMLLVENVATASPVSVLHFSYYRNPDEVIRDIHSRNDSIQCVTGTKEIWPEAIPLGYAQKPLLWDYADGRDTIEFLSQMMC